MLSVCCQVLKYLGQRQREAETELSMFSYFGPFAQSHGENSAHKQASVGAEGERESKLYLSTVKILAQRPTDISAVATVLSNENSHNEI